MVGRRVDTCDTAVRQCLAVTVVLRLKPVGKVVRAPVLGSVAVSNEGVSANTFAWVYGYDGQALGLVLVAKGPTVLVGLPGRTGEALGRYGRRST